MFRLNEFLGIYRDKYQKTVHKYLLVILVILWIARAVGLGAIMGLDVSIAITFSILELILYDIAQNTYQQGRVRFLKIRMKCMINCSLK